MFDAILRGWYYGNMVGLAYGVGLFWFDERWYATSLCIIMIVFLNVARIKYEKERYEKTK